MDKDKQIVLTGYLLLILWIGTLGLVIHYFFFR
jgi:hypothetical protein